MSYTLNACQQAAADKFFEFMVDPDKTEFVIKGSAGTGKSTLLKYLLENLDSRTKLLKSLGAKGWFYKDIAITATTRKAAHVLGDILHIEPLTIHSLLGLKVHNDRETGATTLQRRKGMKTITNTLIVIDEASFVDHILLNSIRKYTRMCKVVFIGDPYQLLPTATAKCSVFDNSIETATLTTVMRNGGKIEELSHQYKDAVVTKMFPNIEVDNHLVEHVDGPTFQTLINEAYTDPDFDSKDVKIVAWTNQRVHQYNDYIRQLKGYAAELVRGEVIVTNKPIMSPKGETVYATDAQATVTDISTGFNYRDCDGAYITLDHETELFLPTNQEQVKAKLKELKKEKDWVAYFDIQEQWADLRPPYACTVHKSQGSTYKKVFVDLSDIGRCNIPTDVARMLYVAISRASEKVVLYGELPQKYRGITNEIQSLAS